MLMLFELESCFMCHTSDATSWHQQPKKRRGGEHTSRAEILFSDERPFRRRTGPGLPVHRKMALLVRLVVRVFDHVQIPVDALLPASENLVHGELCRIVVLEDQTIQIVQGGDARPGRGVKQSRSFFSREEMPDLRRDACASTWGRMLFTCGTGIMLRASSRGMFLLREHVAPPSCPPRTNIACMIARYVGPWRTGGRSSWC